MIGGFSVRCRSPSQSKPVNHLKRFKCPNSKLYKFILFLLSSLTNKLVGKKCSNACNTTGQAEKCIVPVLPNVVDTAWTRAQPLARVFPTQLLHQCGGCLANSPVWNLQRVNALAKKKIYNSFLIKIKFHEKNSGFIYLVTSPQNNSFIIILPGTLLTEIPNIL